MKTIYEEKYNKALESAKRELKSCGTLDCDAAKQIFRIFPELQKSEDELIREELIKFLERQNFIAYESDHDYRKWISWLEKQGESIKIKKGKNYLCTKTHRYAGIEWREGIKYYSPEDYSLVNQGCTYYCPKYSKEEHNNFFEEVEYDGCLEIDKAEPKFKIGDWVRAISSGNIFKILSVNDGLYRVLCYDGVEANYPIEVEKDLEYWTIQDANDGDVLAFKDGTSGILLYKDCLDDAGGVLSYCRIIRNSFIEKEESGWGSTLLSPATKEQRDLLFQKMSEAGYEWDTEKKELIKNM